MNKGNKKEAMDLIIVGVAFVFSSPSQISCLNARNQKMVFVFSICGFKNFEVLSRKQR
jgi:hypothetical protein